MTEFIELPEYEYVPETDTHVGHLRDTGRRKMIKIVRRVRDREVACEPDPSGAD